MTILHFPCATSSAVRRAQRKELLSALRTSGSPVVVDLSGCPTLDHADIELLLECMSQAAGRDTQLHFVAGSSANRLLLEVTRIPSLVPVFNSIEEALASPEIVVVAQKNNEDGQASHPQRLWSV